jgi:hypothetical protein
MDSRRWLEAGEGANCVSLKWWEVGLSADNPALLCHAVYFEFAITSIVVPWVQHG